MRDKTKNQLGHVTAVVGRQSLAALCWDASNCDYLLALSYACDFVNATQQELVAHFMRVETERPQPRTLVAA